MRGGASIQAGSIYHLISRFVAKEWFIESDAERRVYLSLLGAELVRTDWRCFCFAVMSSHIHLGLVAGTSRLRSWLRPVHTVFANWLNERRDRIGAVFVRGPHVIDVRPDRVARLIDYVHLNPVRAGVVARPEESDWTSYRAYAGLAKQAGWLHVDRGLELAGFATMAAFERWSASAATDRAEMDALGLLPHGRRGRPRRSGTAS
jgi:putative transposase